MIESQVEAFSVQHCTSFCVVYCTDECLYGTTTCIGYYNYWVIRCQFPGLPTDKQHSRFVLVVCVGVLLHVLGVLLHAMHMALPRYYLYWGTTT